MDYKSLTRLVKPEVVINTWKMFGVPYATYHSWETGRRNPPDYFINLTIYYLTAEKAVKDADEVIEGLIARMDHNREKIEKAQDYLHDNRIAEAIEIIDNL